MAVRHTHGTPGAASDAAVNAEAHLRRLDTASLAALVADCWSARGFDVRRDDGLVVATGDVEAATIAPVGRRRVGSPSLPDHPVDVVVAPRPGDAVRAYADRHGADLLDAADLRGMLWHAMDREDADTIAAKHLGAPLADLPPPASIRARERLVGATSVATAEPAVTLSLVVLALVAVASVTAFGTPGDPGRDLLDRDRPTAAADTPVPVDPGTEGLATPEPTTDRTPRTVAPEVDAVPGLGTGGVTNASALATAHERALDNTSYTVWLDVYAPRDRRPGATTVQQDIDVQVEGERVLVRTEEGDEGADRQHVGTAYHDGQEWFAVDESGTNTTYHRSNDPVSLPVPVVDPHEFRRLAVERFVAARDTTVSGPVMRDGQAYYRVEGTGTPAAFSQPGVENYAVTAFVTQAGFVAEARATYSVRTPSGAYDVTLTWTYGNRGETVVPRPAWVTEEFDGMAVGAAERAVYPPRNPT